MKIFPALTLGLLAVPETLAWGGEPLIHMCTDKPFHALPHSQFHRIRPHHHRLPSQQLRTAPDRALLSNPPPQRHHRLPRQRRDLGRLSPLLEVGALHRPLPLHRRQRLPAALVHRRPRP